ncbi:MAG TPA: diacylglycerol kinase family protein [Chloroflexota bacterium]|nr:diacylglycerol kinase family protein [Chloroflexota bacterium]
MPRAVVLLNPRSRSGRNVSVGRILEAFAEAAWSVELWAGDSPDWTVSAAVRARDLGVDAIFGAGGDGVLAQILPAIVNTDVALGVVPLGTGNVWARELRLPLQPRRAIVAQLVGPTTQVDVGLANGRLFLAIASVGLDARIVELVESDAGAKALGQLAYPLAGLALASGLRGTATRVWLDDDPPIDLNLLAGIITNGRLYGGLVPLVPQARFDDGVLDASLFVGGGPFEATAHAARVLAGLHQARHDVVMRRVRRARFESLAQPLPVQTDGDILGTTPLAVEVKPAALRVLGVTRA